MPSVAQCPTQATPVPREVCSCAEGVKSCPITPILPSPTSSGASTAPPSALAPPQVHLVFAKETTLPGASPGFPTNRLERRRLSPWPAVIWLLPLPTLETIWPEPAAVTPNPPDMQLFSFHRTPPWAVCPPTPAWPGSSPSIPKARARLPFPPSFPP